jgi:hypothetical protein
MIGTKDTTREEDQTCRVNKKGMTRGQQETGDNQTRIIGRGIRTGVEIILVDRQVATSIRRAGDERGMNGMEEICQGSHQFLQISG